MFKYRTSIGALLSVLSSLLVASPATAQRVITLTVLASNAAARGINDAGEVVGECYVGIGSDPRACDFSAGAHTRRNFPVSARSSAADINSAGRVTGSRETAGGTRGFQWLPATGELVDLPPITRLFRVHYRNAEALALNDAGVSVGGSWDDGGQHHATIWLGDGTSRDLNAGIADASLLVQAEWAR